MTQLNLVIGYPLQHSQSPLLHHFVYRQLGIDAILLAKPHDSLFALIKAIKTLSVELTAVTAPYKEKVIPYLDECSQAVRDCQAANTVIQRERKLIGYNTDIDGIAFALRDVNLYNKNVIIFGAGGAAKAMGYFLQKTQANIFWINRTKKKAMLLAKQFGGEVINNDQLYEKSFDIIVHTTPIGIYPNIENTIIPEKILHQNQIVFDMVYHPKMTLLLKQAKKKGATIISGLEMFVGQGLKQIELWRGERFDLNKVNQLKTLLIKNQNAKKYE